MIDPEVAKCPYCHMSVTCGAYEYLFIMRDLQTINSSLVKCKNCKLLFRIVIDKEGNIDTQ